MRMPRIAPVVLMLAGHASAKLQPDTPPHDRPLRALWTVPLNSDSFGGAAAADVDGDGRIEIGLCTYFGDSRVLVLNGEDGSVYWEYDASDRPGKGDSCLDASLRFTDLGGDGALELVAPVSDKSSVLAFDAYRGLRLWRYEAGVGHCIDTPPWIGDADGDGSVEIVVGTFKGDLHVIGADGVGKQVLHVAPGAVQSCPVVMDVNGDRVNDYIAGNFKGDHRLVCVSGVDGAVLWEVQTGGHIYHGPSVGNLDGDEAPDLAFGSYDGKVYAVSSRDGKVLWTGSPGDHYFMSPTAMADLDGDGRDEVFAASVHATAFGSDGRILWSVPTDKPGDVMQSVTRGVSLADLDGDGGLDAAFVNTRGLLRVVRASNGERLAEYDPAGTIGFAPAHASNGPLIADGDGDGALDIVFACGNAQEKRGAVVCVTGFTGRGRGWYMLRHDHLNTGNVRTELEAALVKRLP